jgi:predicted Zn-dependent protease with MMP-like domain/Flp pilus assembly protein TadD
MGRLRTHTWIALAIVPAFGCGLGVGLLLTTRPAPVSATEPGTGTDIAPGTDSATGAQNGAETRAGEMDGAGAEAKAMNHPSITAGTAGPGAEPGAPADDEQVPFAECPLPRGDSYDPDRLLDAAADRYDAGSFAESFACASMAGEIVPDAVESHHIRALASAALGRFEVARSAYALALALDPEDPETLAAAADFYINVLVPKRRETTLLGLQYAHRGRSRVVARRRHQRPMRARLALLEAQAYNDLGIGDEAMERLEETLSLMPNLIEAKYERAVSLFNLCRFEDARTAFEDVLRATPDDPYAHHHLGLVYEWLGREQDAQLHFARARALAPGEFLAPVLLASTEFRAEVDRALTELPAEIAALLQGVSVEVSDVPALDDLLAVEPPFSPTILGLYRGLPLGVEQDASDEPAPPRAVVLYRKNLARAVKSRAELDAQIRRTLLHEIGHLQGMDESDLRLRGLD